MKDDLSDGRVPWTTPAMKFTSSNCVINGLEDEVDALRVAQSFKDYVAKSTTVGYELSSTGSSLSLTNTAGEKVYSVGGINSKSHCVIIGAVGANTNQTEFYRGFREHLDKLVKAQKAGPDFPNWEPHDILDEPWFTGVASEYSGEPVEFRTPPVKTTGGYSL